MRNIITFILLLIFFDLSIFSQDAPSVLARYTPPSPQAANFIRYGEIPVSHATGVPQIEIPIYTIQTGNYSFPISISYHAGGIKVRDIASSVGLGWVLNAGGLISRTIVGAPDNLNSNIQGNKRFFFSHISDVENAIQHNTHNDHTWNRIMNKIEPEYDTQSDRFFYSVNGLSGNFRFDAQTGELKTIPYTPIKVEMGDIMAITDTKGVKYIFSQTEKSKATASPVMGVTSWYLTKIKFPGIDDDIDIAYKYGKEYNDIFYTQTLDWPTEITTHPPRHCRQKQLVDYSHTTGNSLWSECVLIDKIIWRNTIIKFEYKEDRKDIRKERLSKISVSHNSSEIQSVTFDNNSYFGDREHSYRMRLNGLSFKNGEKYSFKYNPNSLPSYYSDPNNTLSKCKEDYWGYYNGISQYLFPGELIRLHLSAFQAATNYSGNRNSSTLMSACALEEITYPTGGRTIFEFEPNRAKNVYEYNKAETIVGGLRVKRILNYKDKNASPEIKTYKYDVPNATSLIDIGNFFYEGPHYLYAGNTVINGSGVPAVFCENNKYYTFTSSSVCPLIAWGTTPAFYNQIIEYKGEPNNNHGWVEYRYFPSDQDYSYCASEGAWPYTYFSPAADCDRGQITPLLGSEKRYDNNGNLVSSTVNNYEVKHFDHFFTGVKINHTARYNSSYNTIRGFRDPQGKYPYLYYFYQDLVYFNTWAYPSRYILQSTTESEYRKGKEITRKTEYSYDPGFRVLEPIKIKTTDSKGNVYTTENRYIFNNTGSVYTQMIANNILSEVVETNKYKNNVFLEGQIYHYGSFGSGISSFYKTNSIENRHKDLSISQELGFDFYDKNGNVIQYTTKDGKVTTLLWGYNCQYLIAEIKNATYEQVKNKLTVEVIDRLTLQVEPFRSDLDKLNSLRSDAAFSMAHITTHTYRPLIGITSTTDPAGISTYYVYNNANKLELILDDKKNIIESYEYNYGNQ